MNILEHEQVLTQELTLLDLPGPDLSSYYVHDPDNTAFLSPPPDVAHRHRSEYKMDQIRSCGNRINSQFHLLTCVLMKIFYGPQRRNDLLQKLKCTLYSPDVPIDQIMGMPRRELKSGVMKKILVEFFQVMQYNEGPCESILDKYPIVLEIFTLFLRTILQFMKVPKAKMFNQQVDPDQTFPIIFEYFDINYHVNKDVYLLYQEQIAVRVDRRSGECYYGTIGGMQREEEDEDESNMFNFEGKFDQFSMEDMDRKDQAPTPCFGEFPAEELNFNKKGNARKNSASENKMRSSAFETKLKQATIREETEDEELEDKKRNSIQFRRNSEDICQKKIFYDIEDRGGKEILNAIESPKISSPASDLDLQGELEKIFEPKVSTTIEHRHGNKSSRNEKYLRLEESTSKSEIQKSSWNKNRPASHLLFGRYNTEVDDESEMSSGTCTCTEVKARKNELFSNVFDVSFKPNFLKKCPSPPAVFNSRPQQTKQVQKRDKKNAPHRIPAFLTNRQPGTFKNLQQDLTRTQVLPGYGHAQDSYRKTPPPQMNSSRIHFSYRTQHVHTEPVFQSTHFSPKLEYSQGRQVWNQYADRRLVNLQRPPSHF